LTPTPTSSPVPVSTPYFEHFEETTVVHPGGWWTVDNSQIATSGTGSAKLATASSSKNYGIICSDTMTMDVSIHNRLHVVVTEVDASTGDRVLLHEQGQGAGVEVVTGLGVTDMDFPMPTGWSGVKTFFIEIVIETATGGMGARFDEIWIYPENYAKYAAHFNEAAGKPGGWWEVYNASIQNNGQDSAKASLAAYPPSYCQITCDTQHGVDLDVYRRLKYVITGVDPSTGNIIKLHNITLGQEAELGRGLGAGSDYLPIPAGWHGTVDIYIEIVIESGSAGVGTRFDEIAIMR